MQNLIIAGRVGKDAVLRSHGDNDVLNFSLAVDQGKDKNGQKRDPSWFDCSLWGKRAKPLAQHIVKGTALTVIGRPTARAHEGKAYLGVNVDQLTFGGGGDAGSGGGYSNDQGSGYGGGSGGYDGPSARDMDDTDIPF